MRKCRVWSAPYDGENPDPELFSPASLEGTSKLGSKAPAKSQRSSVSRRNRSKSSSLREKAQVDLEWDDSYDTGMSPGSDDGSLQPFFPAAVKQGTVNEAQPTAPPKHIQEMKKSALMLIRGSYIEESDFNDDVMVYRLCADKDAQDSVESHAQKVNARERSADQKAPLSNGLAGETTQGATRDPVSEKQSLASANPEQGTEMEHSGQGPAHGDHNQEDGVNVESKASNLSMETEDFLSQYHDLLAKLNYNPNELVALNLNTSEPSTPTEDEDDFEKFTVAPHSDNLTFPFGPKAHLMFSHNPARIHGAPFTGTYTCRKEFPMFLFGHCRCNSQYWREVISAVQQIIVDW